MTKLKNKILIKKLWFNKNKQKKVKVKIKIKYKL